MADDPDIGVTVVGGYLGSGKTTLVNRLLASDSGTRWAVIVNDFGDLAIDADLIDSGPGDLLSLDNGCICCSLADGLVSALDTIAAADPRPDHLVIETSGVSDPGVVAGYARLPGFALDSVVVLVDAETVIARSHDRYVGETVLSQIRAADLLVVNKVDLAGADTVARTVDWLGRISPGTPALTTTRGSVAGELLGATPRGVPRPPEGGNNAHEPRLEVFSVDEARTLRPGALESFLADLPAGVLRVKGVVAVEGVSARRTVHRVGRRVEITSGTEWGSETPRTRLVVIAEPGTVDEGYLESGLA